MCSRKHSLFYNYIVSVWTQKGEELPCEFSNTCLIARVFLRDAAFPSPRRIICSPYNSSWFPVVLSCGHAYGGVKTLARFVLLFLSKILPGTQDRNHRSGSVCDSPSVTEKFL